MIFHDLIKKENKKTEDFRGLQRIHPNQNKEKL